MQILHPHQGGFAFDQLEVISTLPVHCIAFAIVKFDEKSCLRGDYVQVATVSIRELYWGVVLPEPQKDYKSQLIV
jgi:hypothetical protein